LLRALRAARIDLARRFRSDLHRFMNDLVQNARKRDAHESTIRNVVDFAREVRVHLQDAQVIFGSVTPAERGQGATFRIRPWGMKQSMEIQFADVTLAAPVKQMGWEQHRAIASAQQAGNFTTNRKIVK
jgi:hypothetical protein